jgi:hypothetical protein
MLGPFVNLPDGLPVTERYLLEKILRSKEGSSLQQLEQTNFQSIRDAIGDAQVVLIGEATHGTEEFYRVRADLTKSLLLDGFDAVCIRFLEMVKNCSAPWRMLVWWP